MSLLVLTTGSERTQAQGSAQALPSVKVAFLGDSGTGSNFRDVLQLISDQGADFVLHQGDFGYGNEDEASARAWNDQINAILGADYPYFGSVGNHDVRPWSTYRGLFQERLIRNPDAVCQGDYGVNASCHYKGIFFILSGVGTMGSDHGQFIENQLAQNDSTWSVCTWHKNQRAMQLGNMPDDVGWGAYEACREGGAIIATGHHHTYSRTRTLTDIENQVVDPNLPGPNNVRVIAGSTFVFVSGLGGKGIGSQQRCLPTTYPYGCNGEWASIYTSDQGAKPGALFIEFNLGGDPNKARGQFINVDGEVIDDFMITAVRDNIPPTGDDQQITTAPNTARAITLTGSDPEGDPLTFTVLNGPSSGVLGGNAPSLTYTPDADFTGSDSFTFVANDGTADSGPATVSITVTDAGGNTLLNDDFNRTPGTVVGNGWVEIETPGSATVSIAGDKLFFADTSDVVNRPLVRRTFSPVATGTLQWDYDFNWTRTGNEGTYRVLMQLGDSAVMSDTSQSGGAGINLIWTSIGGVHQTLGYRKGGVNTPLTVMSGPAHISVSVDLTTKKYSVTVKGTSVGTGIPFDANVPLNTVRFLTDNLNEVNFSGRTIDNLIIATSGEVNTTGEPNTSPVADAGDDQNVNTGDLVTLDGSGSSDADGDPLTFVWTLTTVPAGSNASLTGAGTASPSFVADLAGTYQAQLVVNDGAVASPPDSVTITATDAGGNILPNDDFNRAAGPVVGNGWVEIETPGSATVSIAGFKLFFDNTSDATNRPLVRRTFSPVATGTLQWDYDFDWTRTGNEGTYRVLMQMGDSAVMSDTSQSGGAGVNLIWTSISGVHQTLGYTKTGVNTPLTVISSGPHTPHISVTADLDAKRYSVAVNGTSVGTGILFDANVASLDTVRFLTDGVNEANFSGRTFDNVLVRR